VPRARAYISNARAIVLYPSGLFDARVLAVGCRYIYAGVSPFAPLQDLPIRQSRAEC